MTELFEDDLLDVEGLESDDEVNINSSTTPITSARQRLEELLEKKRLDDELKDIFED